MTDIFLIDFPKQLKTSFVAYEFLINVYSNISKAKCDTIILNMRRTKYFNTNLLAILSFMFVEWINKGKNIGVILPSGEIGYGNKMIYSIFNYYAEDKRAFFKPRFISDDNAREKEDVLLKYLKRIGLEKYDVVKTLISEIFANIEMHTDSKIGCIAGGYSKEENMIVVSIVNTNHSIAKQLEMKRGMIFANDFSALMWSLKKTNSTRNIGESGGLGLYLLRKYIYELKGKASILTGKCYIELDGESFDIKNENVIQINEKKEINYEYQGTVVTLYIPYVVDKSGSKYDEELTTINLLDIMEK